MGKPSRSDLLTLGLPAPAAAQPPRLVEQVTIASGLLYITGHNLTTDALLSLRRVSVTTIGAVAAALPGGLSEGVAYYARPATADALQLATAASPASAISSFSSEPVGRFAVLVDPGLALDKAIDDAWTIVHARLTAHGGDVEAPIVTLGARYLAARVYVAHLAAGDPAKAASFDGLTRVWESEVKPLFEAYFKGTPVRGGTDETPDTLENAAVLVELQGSEPFDLCGGEVRA